MISEKNQPSAYFCPFFRFRNRENEINSTFELAVNSFTTLQHGDQLHASGNWSIIDETIFPLLIPSTSHQTFCRKCNTEIRCKNKTRTKPYNLIKC